MITMSYITTQEKRRKYRLKKRMEALKKLANGSKSCCVVCACPHLEILQFGHPQSDGKNHRASFGNYKDSHGVVSWILKTPIDDVLKRVQLECPYCNAWHQKFKEYPQASKRPRWSPILG